VSFVALQEDDFPKIDDKIQNIAKAKQSRKKEKEVTPKKKPKKKLKKQKKSNSKKKVTKKPGNNKKNNKKKAIKATQESKNVEKILSINLSARERINVRLQIKQCYKKAIYETSSMSDIPIKVSVKLKLNGAIINSSIKVVNKENYKDYPSDLNVALANAKKALQLCSPLRNLPTDKYEIWKEMEFIFDAKE
jgi:hypothetical protein